MSVCVSYFLPCFIPWTHLTCNTPVTVHITFDRVLIRRRYTNCLWMWTADDIDFSFVYKRNNTHVHTKMSTETNDWHASERERGSDWCHTHFIFSLNAGELSYTRAPDTPQKQTPTFNSILCPRILQPHLGSPFYLQPHSTVPESQTGRGANWEHGSATKSKEKPCNFTRID